MKNITSSLSGLTSSLLLNVGLTRLAQNLDPVSSRPSDHSQQAHGPAYCFPSQFSVKRG